MNYGKKATMQLLRKYDNKSSKVKNKVKLIVLKILLVFNMLLLQSRMNAFTTTTASTCMVSEEPLSPVCQRADSVREPAR